ncbi:MAG: hypothetical protein H6819_11860 [Phycisphaerales bacterium]|nr:hypothetical protein [Phycisphaerales bacterium]MCB9854898.1 hypothetical protein [Phycisphaerales bacterium]MCB9864401.1 hypothetical protein [Phycisphaerales bacterium]
MILDEIANRQSAPSPIRYRNSLLDGVFYDVGALTADERRTLSPMIDREGSIVVVSPAASNREIRHYKSALRFFTNEGDHVSAAAVAGVGSSVLGTAAMARNIANAYGVDVAGLVTGYGMADLLTEALGGWFFYGAMDWSRLEFKRFVENLKDSLPEAKSMHHRSGSAGPRRMTLPGNQDSGTLLDVLIARPPKLKLIVGHSKGALLIDYVLDKFVAELNVDAHPYFEELVIVTIGTVVGLSEKFLRLRQYLGEYDWFGKMNSRVGLPYESVPNAWHHLNTHLPNHVPLERLLADLPIGV